jgi:hypothetical protein
LSRPSTPTGRSTEVSRTVESFDPETKGDLLEDADNASERRESKRESSAKRESIRSMQAVGVEHFAKFLRSATSGNAIENDDASSAWSGDGGPLHLFMLKVERVWLQIHDIEEPPRTGRFAKFIMGKVFEAIITFIILTNAIWMMYAADVQIKDPAHDDTVGFVGELVFQFLYTVEMVLRLAVHRQWFFFNASWKLNVFELALVIAGFVTLGTASSSSGAALRLVRLMEIGRAARVLRAMTHLRHLRALIVCLQGSLTSLTWSLVMVFLVYSLFSLFLVQIITSHLIETGEAVEATIFYEPFGSIWKSILTLHKASTGGDDWSQSYQLIQTTGEVGCAVYLVFIIFMQFALLNIITGIFVESAMSVLQPDPETLAMEISRQDHMNAQKLDRLCRAVDADESGKLTREQFEDGLHKKHIPLMLKSLGLHRHHLVEFFEYMAEVQNDDGQVDIDTFVNGCMLLKGVATNFDLQKLHAEFKATHVQHEKHLQIVMGLLNEKIED